MGEVLGIRSMTNSISQSGGISGSSSGNTSGYSLTTGTSSRDLVSMLKAIMSGLLHLVAGHLYSIWVR